MDDKQDALKRTIDDLDDLAQLLLMPLSEGLIADGVRQLLPPKVDAVKRALVDLTGQDPWHSVR